MSPISAGPRQVTVNDIIHADERIIALKKKYHEANNKKNQKVLELSYVEADIIKAIGAFEYLNGFQDIEDAQKEMLPTFRRLITKKHILIEEAKDEELVMEDLTKTFNQLAEQIVKELQQRMTQSGSAPESAPESAPDDTCACGECHGECKGHNDAPSA